jgi:hypothetical protein
VVDFASDAELLILAALVRLLAEWRDRKQLAAQLAVTALSHYEPIQREICQAIPMIMTAMPRLISTIGPYSLSMQIPISFDLARQFLGQINEVHEPMADHAITLLDIVAVEAGHAAWMKSD